MKDGGGAGDGVGAWGRRGKGAAGVEAKEGGGAGAGGGCEEGEGIGMAKRRDAERLAVQMALAARNGDAAEVERLADKLGASGMEEREAKRAGKLAAWHGHAKCLRVLGERGWDPNERDESGRTAGHLAAEITREIRGEDWMEAGAECLRELLRLGWDPESRAGTAKETAGMRACAEGNRRAAEALLEGGWDPNGEDRWGNTAGHLAAMSFAPESLGCLEALLESGKWDWRRRNGDGRTAEEAARFQASVEAERMLRAWREAAEMGVGIEGPSEWRAAKRRL